MPRYTKCPYYQSDKRQTITCEDACRRFKSLDDKWTWMDKYCDKAWESCKFAMDMNKAYRRQEEGDITALDKEKVTALGKENSKLLSALGRAEKRISRQQKKIDELRAVNKSFTSVNNSLEQQKKDYYSRWRSALDELNKVNESVMAELNKLGSIYEQRMAYLIEQYAPDGVLAEDDVAAWAGDKEFAIVLDANADHGRFWKVVYKDDKNTDEQTEE